ncbi:MAG: response regulator transcription factor [Actinomycetes bacterium]
MTRVLIADDEQLFAEALCLILGIDDRIEVVGRAHDGDEAVRLAREFEPDVVVMDLSMPGTDGLLATAAIVAHRAATRVLILSGSADPADVAKAQRAGAAGYLTKENIAEDLVPQILAVAS